ncbi:MAG: nucleotide sugar dehydrogenase [Pseudomonadota bacterium]
MTSPTAIENAHLAVIGLGYVGLPLAVSFGHHFNTTGFDISSDRIAELRAGNDSTLEVDSAELAESKRLRFADSLNDLEAADVYIVTVPTPIDHNKQPDLSPLESACRSIGTVLRPGNIVIFESTVYPGTTEEYCGPILEEVSGLSLDKDFFLGYSPERINPGDKQHRITDIVKVTAGSTPEIAKYVDDLYGTIIKAGTHLASSIKVAEAAKVIENTQRDLNIALINELALIFDRLDIDTLEVLEAAGTKWNFLPFRPGLVGGHCIGVDPYYLTHKALQVGYHPEVILAGRKLNDGMGVHVASKVVKLMTQARRHVFGAKILVLGLTFKENCPDLRNSRVIDIINELRSYNAEVDVHDPWVEPTAAKHEFGIDLLQDPPKAHYDAIILAVAHKEFSDSGIEALRALGKPGHIFFDIKSVFPADQVDDRL